MVKFLIVFFSLSFACFFTTGLRAQSLFFNYFTDTIRPSYRVSGVFDSMDVASARYQQNLPTIFQPANQSFSFLNLHKDVHPDVKTRFSAIPHVGFRYSMGTNATQEGKIMYTQALDSFTFLQLDYQRNVSQGALRNGNFEYNSVAVQLLKRKKRLAFALAIKFLGEKRSLNGGLLGDTLSDPLLGLIFQDVSKNNVFSTSNFSPSSPGAVYKENKTFQLTNTSYLSFTSNDQLKTGIFVNPYLSIENRRFIENGSINTIYGVANYDTSATRDFWQKSEIGAWSGYFLHSKQFQLNAGVVVNYWDYDNLLRHRDTVMVLAKGDLMVASKRGLIWKSTATLNLAGAIGELSLTSSIHQQFKIGRVAMHGGYKKAYPELYQREYYSNTTNYSWTNRTLFTHVYFGGALAVTKNKTTTAFSANYEFTDKLPLFIGDQWRQDTLNQLSVLSLKAVSSFVVKRLFFQPSITVQLSENTVVPKLLVAARVGFNGTLFKAKKMKTALGVDLGYTSSYQLMEYVPYMQTYSFSTATNTYAAMPKLHLFANFDLGFFRWFLRLENIEQTFQKKMNFEALGYPVVPMQFRFGVSWDLFN
jgi:hypothetical protein